MVEGGARGEEEGEGGRTQGKGRGRRVGGATQGKGEEGWWHKGKRKVCRVRRSFPRIVGANNKEGRDQ